MKTKTFVSRFFARSNDRPWGDGTVYIQYLTETHVQGVGANMKPVWENKQYDLPADWFAARTSNYTELSMMQAAQYMARVNGIIQ